MGPERMTASKEFKREVIKLARQPGASLEWIARDLGISMHLLERWLRAATATIEEPAEKTKAVSLL